MFFASTNNFTIFYRGMRFYEILDFVEERIPSYNGKFQGYLGEMRERIKDYKCGEIQTELKGMICGYFRTSRYTTIEEGKDLLYLGKVREERYLVPINELKYTKDDWAIFLREIGLI